MTPFLRAGRDIRWHERAAIAVLWVSCLAAGWMTVLAPARAALTDSRRRAAVAQASLVQAQAATASQRRLEDELRALESRLGRGEAARPPEGDREDAWSRLIELAASAHLRVSRYAPKPGATTREYAEWPIEFTLEGTYGDLRQFFSRVETMPELMAVSDFEIKAAASTGDRSGAPTLAARCTATTFVWTQTPPRPADAHQAQTGSVGDRS